MHQWWRLQARVSGPLELLRELRQTVRIVIRNPGYSAVVVATLSLAIGASTMIFSVIDPVLLATLPYPEPQQLVVLSERSPGPSGRAGWVSPLTFRDWREQASVFSEMASYRLDLQAWTGGARPLLLRGWAVSAGFFEVMGLDMTLGRGFTAAEDAPGGARVVVISKGFWISELGADPSVLGRSITLGGDSHTIVGLPPLGSTFLLQAATGVLR